MFEPFAAIGVAAGFLVGLVAHELAHNRLAVRLGDRTPKLAGRMTPAITAHADVIGTYVLPGVFVIASLFGAGLTPFGWTKKHALGARGYRSRRRDAVLVALAGPAATAALAAVLGAIARRATASNEIFDILAQAAVVCSALTIFELLPLPGLDGGRVLALFLAPAAAMRFDEFADYKVLFLLVLFLFLPRVANNMLIVACDALARLC